MDPEALERKRLQDAEAWRLEQLRSGTSSEENANFQVTSMQIADRGIPHIHVDGHCHLQASSLND